MARFGLSRKTEYALLALTRLAQQREAGAAPGVTPGALGVPGAAPGAPGVLSARDLAESEAVPLPVLSGLLKQLQRAGLVASRRGVRGGYHLSTAPDKVHLAAVIRAVEAGEPVRLTRCCGVDGQADEAEGDASCRIACTCPIRHAIQALDRRLSGFLEQLTLADLMAENN
ncbi:MAG: Rrf2 family transcriptional regulator [Phycisphaeraceae bacterium]